MFITTTQLMTELSAALTTGLTGGFVLLMSGAVPTKAQQDELVDAATYSVGVFSQAKIKTWVETAGKGGGKIIAQYDLSSAETTIELKYNKITLGLSKITTKGVGLITPTPTPTWAFIGFLSYTSGTVSVGNAQAHYGIIATVGIGEASTADLKIAGAVAQGQDFKLGDLKFNLDTLSI